MRKYLLLLSIILTGTCAISQTNYIDGFIINNNGDTIHGSIDYRNWKNNPESVGFLNSNNSRQVFSPADIKGFFVSSVNESYMAFDVEMDMLPDDADDAINKTNIDSVSTKQKAFLLQLINSSSLKLYEFAANRKEHFYFLQDGETPVELLHHYIYYEPLKQVQEVNSFRQQLGILFAKCTSVASKAARLKYRKSEIQNLFLQYMQCNDPATRVTVKKSDPLLVKFGVVAGFGENQFNFQGANSTIVDDNYSNNTTPLFGVSLDIGLPRNQNKWHIVNELMYKNYKTSSSFERRSVNGYQLLQDIDFGFAYMQVNSLLRYMFPKKSVLRPFINAGFANAFLISENQNNLHTKSSFGTETNEDALDGPRKYEFSLQGGAGIIIKKFSAEARLQHSKKGFSNQYSLDVKVTSYQLLLTYQL